MSDNQPVKKPKVKIKECKSARVQEAESNLRKIGFKTRAFQTITKGEMRFTLEAWL